MDINKLREYMNSEEGKKSLERFAQELINERRVIDSQIERLHDRKNLKDLIEKVIAKYESDEYKERWYRRGIFPQENLYSFLNKYAIKYGRECTTKEWEKYGNMFTSSLVFCKGYYFNLMHGQGSAIQIFKK